MGRVNPFHSGETTCAGPAFGTASSDGLTMNDEWESRHFRSGGLHPT